MRAAALAFCLAADPAAAQTTFVEDTFTGTDGTLLSAHNPDVGNASSWSLFSGSGNLQIATNAIQPNNGGSTPLYKNSTSPPTADYVVAADCTYATTNGANHCTLLGRVQSTNTDWYEGEVRGDGSVIISKTVSGSATTLSSACTTTVTAGSTYRIRFLLRGSSLSLEKDGTSICSVTDTSITAAGAPGVGLEAHAQAQRMRMDNLVIYTSKFGYRRAITIPDSMTPASCSGSLSSFPILVSITDNTLRTRANGGRVETTAGWDIVFRADDGVTALDHEIETYNASTGQLVAWVRIPTLAYNAATTIYMYYGNGGVIAATQNPTGVWNSAYKAVWHLSEATASNRADSTSNANALTPSASQPAQTASGKIGFGADFERGSSQKLSRTDASQTGLDITGVMTVETWLQLEDTNLAMGIVGKSRGTGTVDPPYFLRALTGGTGTSTPSFALSPNSSTAATAVSGPTTSLSGSTWYHLVGVYDGSNLRLYKNGTEETGSPVSYSSGSWNSDGDVELGVRQATDYFDGILDEVRISNTNRDACWVGTTYNSVASPASVGSETSSAPTLVRLESLTAREQPDGRVLLEWRTGFEVDNLGFHVYREVGGERVRATPSLLAGSALLAGGGTALTAGRSYAWRDRPPAGPTAGAYWLEEWDLDGTRRWHGPAVVEWSPEAALAAISPLLGGLGAAGTVAGRVARHWPTVPVPAPESPERLARQWQIAGGAAVKLFVRQTGWYRVGRAELLAAGLDPAVDPRTLRLFADGREVAVVVDGAADGKLDQADGLEFFGTGQDTPYGDTRTYWLTWGGFAGARIGVAAGAGGGLIGPESAPAVAERADRVVYFAALRNGEAENFFGPVVAGEPVARQLAIDHLDPTRPAVLEVRLQGVSATSHRVALEFNGVRAGDVRWQGEGIGEFSGEVAAALVHDGVNTVRLWAEGGELDVSLLDRVRLRYARRLVPAGGVLLCAVPGRATVELGPFADSSVRVFDVTDPLAPRQVLASLRQDSAGWTASVALPAGGTRRMIAVTDAGRQPVAGIVGNAASSWNLAGRQADLVIVGHRSLLAAAEPLRARRASEGMAVAVVDVEDLYDEFAWGSPTPHAIRDFLARCRASWARVPRFVLLLGDASIDPRGYLGSAGADLVPTGRVDTAVLETASDDWLADFDGDGVPEMAVGRLPAASAQSASSMITKLLGYSGTAAAGRVLLVADGNDADNDFELATRRLETALPGQVPRTLLLTGALTREQAQAALRARLDEGAVVANFLGHASVTRWRRDLLTSEGAAGLANPVRPVVLSMSCLTGFFQDPSEQSLAEALLAAPNGGASAVWASSGLTGLQPQVGLAEMLLEALYPPSGGAPTLGEAVIAAKRLIQDVDARRSWLLFADPTMRLH